MPELPEVETVRRGLQPVLEGAVISAVTLARPALRYPFPERFVERLGNRRVLGLGRRSKYLLWEIEGGETLLAHLGMSGSFRIEGLGGAGSSESTPGAFALARSRDVRHDHVRFELKSGAVVVYNDPRRFGFMDLLPTADLERHPRLAGLGIEPTSNVFSAATLAAFAERRTPLKAALLDQAVVTGLGNIYVCEALWRAGLDPRRPASVLADPEVADKLAGSIRAVIAEAIEAGGSTLRDHMRTDGTLGYFQHRFAVYDREGEPCRRPGCGGAVARIRQSGRSTFFCTSCQR
ncbi:bifunctional DNA-formamidopyrimidine glycosylase/DNA-(apurinic or apyrimidinic site) lyase [Pleomorphomonas sp. JP5]|uniref:bifunctional DNA-formamidopyrimidine glycosylase/DNA-(apurinic or apyrimidinic site) lyase n=1 Tax=Pleomorphomonas sp. JP5 TaxID=2942998 RepID=UPI0020448F8D|nr:bifunctional DNA-formamidopyrimidine glycosylase/DNA-(apurinic or apyrimidinic site) lyase [Pleomorphomonas sp. JP5]MCM5559677.1 bifunctional DNA-formamidopyrimidine glycosylase/DNA-(apurinic or apyrimidinic site) lyase [Pleomorphomonas sp. JP5]